jgi:hypothetical protein
MRQTQPKKRTRLAQLAGSSFIAGLIASAASTVPAAALEWRFCIAPANQDHRIYMTPPFSTAVAMEAMESGFHQALEHAGRRHDSVQCPTGSGEAAVRAMHQHADDFNRQMGNEVVGVDWRPTGR